MDPVKVIEKFYDRASPLYTILLSHSRQVARKSRDIALGLPHLDLNLDFIERAAMLHDIGIIKTRSPSIGCTGHRPYICHGYLGREMLDSLGMDPAYGLVAERHTGAGITLDNIQKAHLPLPPRDMVPVTLEEKIICCADKFFSKSPEKQGITMTRDRIIESLGKIDPGHARRFSRWAGEFAL